mgnify:CR=1 FL=1
MSAWEAQLEELVAARRGALVGYAYVLTGSVAQAEDLAHDAIIRSFANRRGFSSTGHAEAYVRRAIATQFLNGRRKHKRFLARVHLFAEHTPPRDPQDGAGVTSAVQAALQGLTPRERACVVLRYFEQLRVREIAEALGLAEGTVKRYLADATAHLTRELGAQFGSDDEPLTVHPVRTGRKP